jgi:FNIP Repeat
MPQQLPDYVSDVTFMCSNLDHTSFLTSRTTHLKFDISFNSPVNSLPNNSTHLVFAERFNQSVDHLPTSLKYLSVPRGDFHHNIDHLPESLTCLKMCCTPYKLKNQWEYYLSDYDNYTTVRFNNNIDFLPQTLLRLSIAGPFNHPVDNLPCNLTHLTLIEEFNHPIDHLPPTLTKLRVGSDFNHPIDHLPLSLVTLKLSYRFNQPIDHLPQNLQNLQLGKNFNFPLDNLPNTLKTLQITREFGRGHYNMPLDHLPSSLATLHVELLTFTHPVDHLPLSLKKLIFGTVGVYQYNLDHLPNLQELVIHGEVPHPMHLPSSLTTFKWQSCHTCNIPIKLPPSITTLDCKHQFSAYPPKVVKVGSYDGVHTLPNTTTHLECNHTFDQPFGPLPQSLLSIHFHISNFNQKVDNLPPNLTHIQFGTNFNQALIFFPHPSPR